MGKWYRSILHKNEKPWLLTKPGGPERRLGFIFLVQQEHKFKRQPCFFYKMCLWEPWNAIPLRTCSGQRSHHSACWKMAGEKHCPWVCRLGFGDPRTQVHYLAPLTETGQHHFFFRNCTPRRSWHSSVIPNVSHASAKPHLLNSARQLKLDMSNWEADWFFLHRKNGMDKNSS